MKTKKNIDRSHQFNLDLKFGKCAEATIKKWLIDLFAKKGRTLSYLYDSDFEFANLPNAERRIRLKEYDLKFDLDGKEIRFEVKTDKYHDTGNLAFEYKDNNKNLSGVFVSKAEYFVYFFPRFFTENVYMIKSESLVKLLSEEEWKVHFKYGGDINETLNFIIPKEEFNHRFIEAGGLITTIDNITIPSYFNLTRFPQKKTTK